MAGPELGVLGKIRKGKKHCNVCRREASLCRVKFWVCAISKVSAGFGRGLGLGAEMDSE